MRESLGADVGQLAERVLVRLGRELAEQGSSLIDQGDPARLLEPQLPFTPTDYDALLTALGEAYPRIRLVTIDATTTSLLPQLASGLLDLAVVNLPASDPDVDVEALFEEDHVVLAPVGHPLAAQDIFVTIPASFDEEA